MVPLRNRRNLYVLTFFAINLVGSIVNGNDVKDDTSVYSASEILLHLYDSTRGLRWATNDGWLQSTDYCSWYGISCYDSTVSDQRKVNHIRSINLSNNRVSGTFPHAVFDLPYIESLIFRNNVDLQIGFDGIVNAQYLKVLDISDTNVDSLDGIEDASLLEKLDITHLGLTGTIPPSLFQLTNLKELYADSNKFEGTLPLLIGRLTFLTNLFLYENDLTGRIPSEIGLLSNLKSINLSQNGFMGTFPKEINNLIEIEILTINRLFGKEKNEGISGPLPSFEGFKDIAVIDLSNQRLSGTIPQEFIGGAPKDELIKIDLRSNRLRGEVPNRLKGFHRIELDLGDNLITNVSDDLCNNIDGWMGGNLGSLGCDAFLCRPGFSAPEGYATKSIPCMTCDRSQYWGTTACVSKLDTSTETAIVDIISERELLQNFYNRMGGRYWRKSDNWLKPSVSICDWHGIQCENEKVTGIILQNNDLSNVVPAEIYTLPGLKILDLSMNSVEVQFSRIGNARNLESLDLTHCNVKSLDSIEELSKTKIKGLYLASNDLLGNLSKRLFSLESLVDLDISHNNFDGNILPEIGMLTNLRTLKFGGNSFSGQIPSEFSKLSELVELSGAENDFTGTLPKEYNLLTNLETLALHQTTSAQGIGGPLPPFRNLGRLTTIYLDSNKLTGRLPKDFLKNTVRGNSKIEVRLSDNQFSGGIPSEWANRFERLFIELSGNQISSIGDEICGIIDKGFWMDGNVNQFSCDAILCPIGSFNIFGLQAESDSGCLPCDHGDALKYFGSKNCDTNPVENEVEISILKDFFYSTNGNSWSNKVGWISTKNPCSDWFGIGCSQSGKILTIDLKENNLQGSVSSSIFQLSSLRELNLGSNKVSFSFEGIDRATNLAVLDLSKIDLTSLDGIGNALSLTELHLTDNDLRGTFPNEVLRLKNLRDVYLNFNSFSGKIPPEISTLSNLVHLFLFHNRFEGQLPASIGRLSNLKTLSLSENNFSGTLPPELNDLTSLEILAIQREGGFDRSIQGNIGVNQGGSADEGIGLSGPLLSFDKLQNLHQLYLGVNSLTGTIPFNFLSSVDDKQSIIEVDLISNRISGNVPASLAQFDQMSIYLAGNKISDISVGLCHNVDWMGGKVQQYTCDAILCPPNTFNKYGRKDDNSSDCVSCPLQESAPFYGNFDCLSSEEQKGFLERDVLELLFRATNGSNWKYNANWLDPDLSVCSWFGIDCISEQNESVESLHLAHNGLRGSIPIEVFHLPNLKEIIFSRNPISMDFSSVGDARKLEYLDLDFTGLKSLSGIENAERLQFLHIAGNDFRGTLPPEVNLLKQLITIDLSDNMIGDWLPSSPSNFESLVFLSCARCGLVGPIPKWIESLPNLEFLHLEENSFTGTIPDFSGAPEMKHLDLSNQVSDGGGLGGLVPAFDGLLHLTAVFLQDNQIHGNIPEMFLQSVDISEKVTVDLRRNMINGSIPLDLSRRSDLYIFLSGNEIVQIPDAACNTKWNNRPISISSCDFVLCSKGTYNALGRATKDLPCVPCPSMEYGQFYGSTDCGKDQEKSILLNIFLNLGGTYWTHSDGWRNGQDFCSWFGITCYESGFLNGRVMKIDLRNNNLKGTLGSSIWMLPYMTELSLQQNGIDVSFSGMGNAQNLETLQLSETKIKTLQGVGNAPALTSLHLTNNEISGTIPEELFGITQLEGLYLNFNKISGTLSKNIGKLPMLKELYLFNNNIEGTLPTELGSLDYIEVLSIGENKFTGTIPIELNWAENLRVLGLQREAVTVDPTMGFIFFVQDLGLTGEILPFSNVPNLRELYLGNNHLQGTLPINFLNGVDDKDSLIKVDLTSNLLHGGVPTSLTNFKDLRLYLASNQIHEVANEICNMTGWMNGEIDSGCDAFLCPPGYYNEYGRRNGPEECNSCDFRGSAIFYGSTSCGVMFPQFLQEKEILRELYLATNGDGWELNANWMNGDIPVCDWHGVKCDNIDNTDEHLITELSLPSNKLEGTVPSVIFYLRSLKVLNLRNNDISMDFTDMGNPLIEELYLDSTKLNSLEGIEQAPNLRILRLFKNMLGGQRIPDGIFTLKNLEILDISDNNLVGTLSSSIGELSALSEFICNGNELSGQIPSEIGNLKNLKDLFLSDNDFYGTLPPSMNNMTLLERFYFESLDRYKTGISGPLLSFSGMPAIREIHLNANVLTGTIPDDFLGSVNSVDDSIIIDFSSNKLTGDLPFRISRFNNLYIDVTSNQIANIDTVFCKKSQWMDGDVGKYGCNGLMCPVGTFNELGRETSPSTPCKKCIGGDIHQYLGMSSCQSQQKMDERKILELLYDQTGGSKWTRHINWMENQVDICDWYGISCGEDAFVESIMLGNNNLIGKLPSDIFELKNLKDLWLYSNAIDFSFEGIFKATGLSSMLLYSTGLKSLKGIGAATSLVDVDVRFNQLRGPLPVGMRNLKHLESFSASSNEISGILPSFSQSIRLTTLRLGDNLFSGTLPSFSNHPKLHSIDLSKNYLFGSIPTDFLALEEISKTMFIDLSSNALTGNVPGALTRFDSFTIFLKENKITSVDPSLCTQSAWNDGDVGLFDCDGILCPPSTFAPASGRASRDGAVCTKCNGAEYFGATTCHGGSKAYMIMPMPIWKIVASTLCGLLLFCGII